jgi:hypothetical protein
MKNEIAISEHEASDSFGTTESDMFADSLLRFKFRLGLHPFLRFFSSWLPFESRVTPEEEVFNDWDSTLCVSRRALSNRSALGQGMQGNSE